MNLTQKITAARAAASTVERAKRGDGKGWAYSSDDVVAVGTKALADQGVVVACASVASSVVELATGKGPVLVYVTRRTWTITDGEQTINAASEGAVLGSNCADAPSGAATAAHRKLYEQLFGLRGQTEDDLATRIERAEATAQAATRATPKPAAQAAPKLGAKLAQRVNALRDECEGAGRDDLVDAIDEAVASGNEATVIATCRDARGKLEAKPAKRAQQPDDEGGLL